MAALRNGIKTVIIPKDNEKDLEEIDQRVRASLHFVTVEHVDEVLAEALNSLPVPVETAEICMDPNSMPAGNHLPLRQ